MNLKKIRLERGLKQNELANLMNIPANTYNQWETGKREPSIEQIKKLSKILKCTVDELLANTDSKSVSA